MQAYTHQFEFEGKTLEVVLKSYKEPFETSWAGTSLYTLVEIFEKGNPIRWGYAKYENPIFDHEQAFLIFKKTEEVTMAFRDPKFK